MRSAVHVPPESYEARAALARWLALRGDAPGPMFCRITRHGRIEPAARIGAHRLWEILRARASAAGLVEHLSPHDLRRTCGGELLERGADLSTVHQ
jgi:integrase